MTTDARQKVLQTIDANRDKAIKFLQQIVSIPSVTGDEGKIQAFLSDYMTNLGLDVDMWESDWKALKKHPGYIPVDRGYEGRPNIVATWKGSGGGRSLLLNGHTDVIPVGNGEGCKRVIGRTHAAISAGERDAQTELRTDPDLSAKCNRGVRSHGQGRQTPEGVDTTNPGQPF